MKTHVAVFWLAAWLAAPIAGSENPPASAPISRIGDIRRLPVSQLAAPRTVRLRGVVTAFSGWKNSFFLQDASGGISIDRQENADVRIGNAVEVTGTIRAGLFAPIVVADRTKVLGNQALPPARISTYTDLAHGQFDSRRIEMEGIVHSAQVGQIWGRQVLFVHLQTIGGLITVHVHDFGKQNFDHLVDSKVRVWGVCGTAFNDRRQLVGVRLFVPDMAGVQVESPAPDLSQIRQLSMDSLLEFDPDISLDHRVRIAGAVTYQTPGDRLYLQENGVGILVQSSQSGLFSPGTRMEAIGFASEGAYSPILKDAILRPIRPGVAPLPVRITAASVITEKNGFNFAPYDGRFVQLEANVVESQPRAYGESWLLREGKVLFQAELRGQANGENLGIEPGSRVSLIGICVTDSDEDRNPKSFRILLRSAQDFSLVHTPYWTVSRSFFLAIFSLLLCVGIIIWALARQRSDHVIQQEKFGRRSSDRAPQQAELDHSPLVPAFGRSSKILALTVAAGGALVLVGWAFQIEVLRSVRSDYVAMKANAALTFLVAGIALWLTNNGEKGRWTRLGEMLGAFVVIVGILTIVEYGTGWNLHIDQLLFMEPGALRATVSPGRMAFSTALAFLLAGCALGLVQRARFVVLAQGLAIGSGTLGLLNLICYVYGIQDFPGIAVYAAMAIHTSILLLLLSVGVLFYRSDCGPMKALSSSAPGGVMGRRLMPAALLVPVALGWLRWQGQLRGLYDTRFGLALLVSGSVVSFCFLIWNSAAFLDRLDHARSGTQRELRDRERQLRESEEHYRLVVESLPQMVWICLPDGRCNYLSRQWMEYTGVPEDEQMEFGWLQRLHPDDCDRFERRWFTAVETGLSFDEEHRLRNASGEYRWFRSLAVPFRDSSGAIIKWFGTSTDIHNMKVAEVRIQLFNHELEKRVQDRTRELQGAIEELSQTQNRLQTILDSATQVAIVALDRDGCVQLFNKGAEQLLGYQMAEVVGKHTPHLFVQLEDCEQRGTELSERAGRRVPIEEIFSVSALPPEPYTREATYLRRDGTLLAVNLAVTPLLDGQGERVGTLSIASDLTLRKRLETRLTETNAELRKQTAEAEKASHAKSDFLAAMSHEIRTPMNSILGTTDLLLETELNPVQDRLVSICRRNSNLLLSLINDLLDLSKIEADAVELENLPFSVLELVEDVEQIFFANAREKGVELRMTVAPDVPAIVVGDPNRLKQVVINLLSNALKFTAAGSVSLAVALVQIEAQTCCLRFAVSDTGIGIAKEHIGSIFGAFQQADSSVTRQFGGTGLGLAICKRLVELMDGRLAVESRAGSGSTFWFTLRMPISEGAAIIHFKKSREIGSSHAESGRLIAPPADANAGSSAAGAILIVEDNADNTFLLESYLSPEGYQLDFARDGGEAVEKVKLGQYALVLMDVQMPVKDGYTATREIRAWETASGKAPVPIVALTAHSLRGEEEKSRQAGCSGYLPKPLVRRDVLREVAARVRSSAPADKTAIVEASKRVLSRKPAYLSRRSADIGRMREFVRDSAFEEIRVLGHQLNGSASGFGFPELSRLGAEIEKAATSQNKTAVQNHLVSFETLVHDLQAIHVNSEAGEDVSVNG